VGGGTGSKLIGVTHGPRERGLIILGEYLNKGRANTGHTFICLGRIRGFSDGGSGKNHKEG